MNENDLFSESLFDLMPSAVFCVDVNMNIIKWNKKAAQITGFTRDEVMGRPCHLFTQDPCNESCGLFNENITKPILGRECKIKTKEGKVIAILKNAEILRNHKGQIVGGIELFEDITERKKAEQLKDDLVSTVSHELRTPLTTIREAVSQVLDGLLGPTTPEQREFLLICLEDVDRLMRIINDLLDISKIEASRVELQRQTIDLVEVIKQVNNTFVPRFREKQLESKVAFSQDRIEVYADRDKIIQVLTNLIGNALKFTEHGCIDISAVVQDDQVECSVTDSGKGIAPEDLGRVFDKFKQVGREYGPGEKGTGLGLAISKGIIELHNGSIRVESEEGKGTRFVFTLPKKTAAQSIVIESLDRLIKFAKKEQKECAIFLIAFHEFEKIEQKYGHEKMDKILNEIFRQFKEIIGFVQPIILKKQRQIVLLSDAGTQDVSIWQERIKHIVKGSAFNIKDMENVNFSCGYAVYPHDSVSAVSLFEKAQNSLADVKKEHERIDILIVDDDRQVVDLLKDALKNFGYSNVRSASDGQQALDSINRSIPDMIILDMQMPHMNGYEVIGHLKEDMKTKDIPILIMSGQPVAFDRLNEYISKKAIPVIGKPVDLNQLKQLLWLLA